MRTPHDPAFSQDGRFRYPTVAERAERGITDENLADAEADCDEYEDERMRGQRAIDD